MTLMLWAVVKLESMSHALVASMQDVFEYSVFVFCILYVLCGLCVTCAVYFCVCFVLSYVLCFWVICAVCVYVLCVCVLLCAVLKQLTLPPPRCLIVFCGHTFDCTAMCVCVCVYPRICVFLTVFVWLYCSVCVV